MKTKQTLPFLQGMIHFGLGACLAGAGLAAPLPGSLQPLVPAAILATAHLLCPRAAFVGSGKAFLMGLALGPAWFCADLAPGAGNDPIVAAGGIVLFAGLAFLFYRRGSRETSPSLVCVAVAFACGILCQWIGMAAALCLYPCAGDGPAADLALSMALYFSLGLGLTAGLFLARRIPDLSLPLCIAALYLVALFCLIYTRPSEGFFEMARNMHKPDDLALEFAAGNVLLALRLCGLPLIALGACFYLVLNRAGYRAGMTTRLFLAWSAGFFLLGWIGMPELWSGEIGLAAAAPAAGGALLGLLLLPKKPIRTRCVFAGAGLLVLGAVALPPLTSSKSWLAFYRVHTEREKFGNPFEKERQVFHEGRHIADTQLCYRFPWRLTMSEMIRHFQDGWPAPRLLQRVGVVKGRLRDIDPAQDPPGDETPARVFLPSVLRCGEKGMQEVMDAFRESETPVGLIVDLSTLSRKALSRICGALREGRPDMTLWVEPPFLMVQAGTGKRQNHGANWAYPTPLPDHAVMLPEEEAGPDLGDAAFAMQLELPDRWGPFPDPRVAASHLRAFLAALPLPERIKDAPPDQAELFCRGLVLAAALARYQGDIAEETRLLQVMQAEFHPHPEVQQLVNRARFELEKDESLWRSLHGKDPTDADARLWVGRYLLARGDSEGLYQIKKACELRDTLTPAFEDTMAGFAAPIEFATGEVKRHLKATIESMNWYGNKKNRNTPLFKTWYGLGHLHGGDTQKARALFKEACAEDPGLALAFQGLAAAYFAEEKFPAALEMVEEALRLNPYRPDPWLMKARTLTAFRPEQEKAIRQALTRYFILKGSGDSLVIPGQ